jgi:hypothetical protein
LNISNNLKTVHFWAARFYGKSQPISRFPPDKRVGEITPLLLLLYGNDRKRNKPLKICVKVATVPAQMTDHVACIHKKHWLSKYSDESFLTLVLHQVPNPTFEIVQKWHRNPTKSFQSCNFH